MDRRNFLRLSAVGSATVARDTCSKLEHQFIRFIPEEELEPGVAQWKPGVCGIRVSLSDVTANDFWSKIQDRGGWWGTKIADPPVRTEAKLPATPAKARDLQFDGFAQEYPFNFLPYA